MSVDGLQGAEVSMSTSMSAFVVPVQPARPRIAGAATFSIRTEVLFALGFLLGLAYELVRRA
jgi:hypothetical protein